MFVIDSCVIIDALNGYKPAIDWIANHRGRTVLPAFVYLEVLWPNMSQQARRIAIRTMKPFDIVKPSGSDWSRAQTEFRDWDPKNKKPGVIDIIIAQISIGLKRTIVTCNRQDFENIKGIDVLVPYQKDVASGN